MNNNRRYKRADKSISADKARIVDNITSRDVEKSIKIDDTQGTKAYYSNRYGWTLRRIIT